MRRETEVKMAELLPLKLYVNLNASLAVLDMLSKFADYYESIHYCNISLLGQVQKHSVI